MHLSTRHYKLVIWPIAIDHWDGVLVFVPCFIHAHAGNATFRLVPTATHPAERLVLVVLRGSTAAPCAPRTDSTAAAAGNTPAATGGRKHSTLLAHGTTSAFPDTPANLAAQRPAAGPPPSATTISAPPLRASPRPPRPPPSCATPRPPRPLPSPPSPERLTWRPRQPTKRPRLAAAARLAPPPRAASRPPPPRQYDRRGDFGSRQQGPPQTPAADSTAPLPRAGPHAPPPAPKCPTWRRRQPTKRLRPVARGSKPITAPARGNTSAPLPPQPPTCRGQRPASRPPPCAATTDVAAAAAGSTPLSASGRKPRTATTGGTKSSSPATATELAAPAAGNAPTAASGHTPSVASTGSSILAHFRTGARLFSPRLSVAAAVGGHGGAEPAGEWRAWGPWKWARDHHQWQSWSSGRAGGKVDAAIEGVLLLSNVASDNS